MNIITNNIPRDVIYGYELTDKERAEFDYLEGDELAMAQFVRYRGEVYALNDFVRIVPRARAIGFEHGADENSPLLKWDGIATDSYFSAHVIRWATDYSGNPDFDRVVIGRAYW